MSTPESQAIFCYEDVRDRCLGNAALIDRVLNIFSEGAETDLLALRKAIDEADLTQATKTAHRIKGSAANSAAYRMSQFASDIECAARDETSHSLDDLYENLTVSFQEFLAARSDLNPLIPTQSTD